MSLLLLDTHLLLWAAGRTAKLSPKARALIENIENSLTFSIVSLWEIVIKDALRRADFRVDARSLRRRLLGNGYQEISITGEHALAVSRLPPVHKDPFDRMLIAQADIEGATLLTVDPTVARYPGSIMLVG